MDIVKFLEDIMKVYFLNFILPWNCLSYTYIFPEQRKTERNSLLFKNFPSNVNIQQLQILKEKKQSTKEKKHQFPINHFITNKNAPQSC